MGVLKSTGWSWIAYLGSSKAVIHVCKREYQWACGSGLNYEQLSHKNNLKLSLFKQQVCSSFGLLGWFLRGKCFNILYGFNPPYYDKFYQNSILLLSLNVDMFSHNRQKIIIRNKTEKDQELKQVEHDYFLEPVKLFILVKHASWSIDRLADLACSHLVFSSKYCQLASQKLRNQTFSLTGFHICQSWPSDTHLVIVSQEIRKQLMVVVVVVVGREYIPFHIREYK